MRTLKTSVLLDRVVTFSDNPGVLDHEGFLFLLFLLFLLLSYRL